MKDIHEVLRHKQAQYTQLGKQIEMLQQAAEKLREVAPLLAENDTEDDSAVFAEVEEENSTRWRRRPALNPRRRWLQAGAQLDSALAVGRGGSEREAVMILQTLLVSKDDLTRGNADSGSGAVRGGGGSVERGGCRLSAAG